MYERTTPKVSIIIPSYFHPDQHGKYGEHETFWFACECLNKLIENIDGDNEIIIIDNGSTLSEFNIKDSKYRYSVSEYFDFADILIRNNINLGFGPACNQGFNVARGEYIICLNNDVLVWPGWIDALLDTYEEGLDPPVGMVMPALMKQTKDAREALEIKEIDLSSNYDAYGRKAEFGSCWVMKKELMEKVKEKNKGYVFNEKFRLGMGEDRWLYCQVRMLGYETYRCHKTRVFHQGNLTIGKIPDRKKYTYANREYLAKLKKEHGIPVEEKKSVPLT